MFSFSKRYTAAIMIGLLCVAFTVVPVLAVTRLPYGNGALIKTKNSPKIYLITAGKKQYISSPAQLKSLGKKKIYIVSDSVLAKYPDYVPVTKSPLNCKNDLKCFTAALAKCQNTVFIFNYKNIPSMDVGSISGATQYTITGWNKSVCVMTTKVLSYDFVYNQTTLDHLHQTGQTDSDIAQTLKQVSDAAKQNVQTCQSKKPNKFLALLPSSSPNFDIACKSDQNYQTCTYNTDVTCQSKVISTP